jgi:glycosyltransferase involved in cell wall biosynthesis
MPKGRYPYEYFQSPTIAKTLPEIYELIDAYTGEFFEEDTAQHPHVDFIVVLPPLSYDGIFVKGLFISQAVDLIINRYPVLKELFVCTGYSMWSSHPWSSASDAYLVCYDNPERTAWFRKANADRSHIAHIPLQDADYTNEYLMAPHPVLERDIDLLCVSRLHSLKNLPVISGALKIYRRKYSNIRMTLIAGRPGAYSRHQMSPVERDQFQQMEMRLGCLADYVDLVEHARHFQELPRYYGRARAVVIGSLLEGKNRSLNEAQSCNTPVICFEELNRYARGSARSFPEGAGLTSPFDEEALADTVHKLLLNQADFRPRAAYLRDNGRRNFVSNCLRSVPYFKDVVPDLDLSDCWGNLWIDLAIQDNYGCSLYDFVYGRQIALSHVKGLERIGAAAEYYSQKAAL